MEGTLGSEAYWCYYCYETFFFEARCYCGDGYGGDYGGEVAVAVV